METPGIGNANASSRGHVLVVDDERGPRESLYFLLKNQYEVTLAASVEEGLQVLRKATPDLVIMDIRMPGRSGIDGLEDMRAIVPDVSIIMLTGYGTLETAQKAIRHGASDYLKKPFDTKEMLDIVRRNVERTQMNHRRSHAEHEIEELTERLRKHVASKDRLSTLGLASAELIHDLRNPLGVILGYAELLNEDLKRLHDTSGVVPPDTLEYLATIEKNVRVCTDLTEMWRSLGSGDVRKGPPLDVWPFLEGLVHETRRPNGVRLELDGNETGRNARVRGEALQLRRAFQNLLSNAIEAVDPRAGRIRISCAAGDRAVTVQVEDNGCGIDPARLPHIFEPFHETTKGRKGTGLGLFIAHKVVDDHAGTIEIDSEVGRGTRMIVRLPLAEH